MSWSLFIPLSSLLPGLLIGNLAGNQMQGAQRMCSTESTFPGHSAGQDGIEGTSRIINTKSSGQELDDGILTLAQPLIPHVIFRR